MRVHKAEVVTRYHVTFTPGEVAKLIAHPEWRTVITFGTTARRNRFGAAMLTKAQINRVCDALGINGREFMATIEVVR